MTNLTRLTESDIIRLLREAGYRATPGRIALLASLKRARKPVSVEALAKELTGTLDQANTYRSLEALAKAGIVRRVDVGHQHMHYELAALKPHHHHYVCVDCGERMSIHKG